MGAGFRFGKVTNLDKQYSRKLRVKTRLLSAQADLDNELEVTGPKLRRNSQARRI